MSVEELFPMQNITREEIIFYVIEGVSSFIGVGAAVAALQLENITIVSIIFYSEILYAVFCQWLYFNDTSNFETYGLWIGLVLIIVSLSLSMIIKQRNTGRNQENVSINTKSNGYGAIDLSVPNEI